MGGGDFLAFRHFFLYFFLLISHKVTKVTTKNYQGYYWKPKMDKNGPKQHNKIFFAQRAKKASAKGQSPPQELEVGLRSGPYLLVLLNLALSRTAARFATHQLSTYRTELGDTDGC